MGKHGKRGGGGGRVRSCSGMSCADRQGGRRRDPKQGSLRPNGEWNDFNAESLKNEVFEEYYKVRTTPDIAQLTLQAQGIVPEGEWDAFVNSLRTELPTTFRVTGSRAHAGAINSLIKDVYVPTMTEVEVEGVKYDPPKPLEWYPNSMAWEVSAPKRLVRRQPAFKSFQRFLVGETSVVGS